MLPVAMKLPVAGSYNSALARIWPESSSPPAISTSPLARRVAVCPVRGTVMAPVGRKGEAGVGAGVGVALGTGVAVAVAAIRGAALVPLPQPHSSGHRAAASTSAAVLDPRRHAVPAPSACPHIRAPPFFGAVVVFYKKYSAAS